MLLLLLLPFFIGAAHAANSSSIFSTACSCSSGFIPVPVDITIPVDPSNPEGLNSTDTFRLQKTFDVFGMLCQPVSTHSKNSDAVQLLLHGQTYTSQYWDVSWGGFQNYSYVAHSCRMGVSSFAYDNPGAGRTTRPLNSKEVQMPTVGNITSTLARDLKSGTISRILTGTEKKYQKVVGFGHSLGSGVLNYAAIAEGSHSPFDGLVLTGMIHNPLILEGPSIAAPASEVNPNRWPNLDPGYITTPNVSTRLLFYGPTNSSFSPAIFQLDELTKDIGSNWPSVQGGSAYTPAIGFSGPVVELVGSFDQGYCIPSGHPCDQAVLQVSEAIYWPDSNNFTMVVIDGYGHDVNLEFGASKAFPIMTQLFESFVA